MLELGLAILLRGHTTGGSCLRPAKYGAHTGCQAPVRTFIPLCIAVQPCDTCFLSSKEDLIHCSHCMPLHSMRAQSRQRCTLWV